jgi:hypothetical protein
MQGGGGQRITQRQNPKYQAFTPGVMRFATQKRILHLITPGYLMFLDVF